MLNLVQLQQILFAQLYIPSHNQHEKLESITFTDISIDNRTIQDNALFIALKGNTFDAHDFIYQLNTSHIALVNHFVDNAPNIIQVIVKDTKKALQDLAAYWRTQFNIPIVAVVGSNGKTSVKEMIYSIFKHAVGIEHTISTLGNLNNDIGLPLSILKLNSIHKLAVFEIGMNHPQETKILANILKPTIAIINNAQREHQEFMHNVQTVAIEHGYLLEQTSKLEYAVLPIDSEFYPLWQAQCHKNNIKIITFGFNNLANFYANKANININGSFTLNDTYNININTLGLHNISNALAAISVAYCANIEMENIINGIQTFSGVKGRLQKSTIFSAKNKSITIINDTYNANPDSVKAAIDVLSSLNKDEGKKLLILGDMGEVGANGASFHEEIGIYAKKNNIDELYGLGELAKYSVNSFNNINSTNNHKNNPHSYLDIEQLYTNLKDNYANFNTILIKGSRFMKMEKIVEFLHKLTK